MTVVLRRFVVACVPALVGLAIASLAACQRAPDPPAVPAPVPRTSAALPATSPPAHDDGIAWRTGDVDAAFAEARAANKPVFLYWGAKWCPPCNQMKATLFNRREFAERAEHFVPVYIDGDTPAAQRLGTRFSVSGYPTMVLFRPDGTEITRLPGEADPEHYLQVLAIGMNSARPVRATLAAALGDGQGLAADDWRMLAWYSFDTDDQQLVAATQVAPTLARLATRCPAALPDVRARLVLKAAAASDDDSAGKGQPPFDRQAALAQVERVLASPTATRENFDLLADAMPAIVKATTSAGTSERTRLVANADRALTGLENDPSLSNTDRLDALVARVGLRRLDLLEDTPDRSVAPILGDALRQDITTQVARADRESTDPYERQTVVNAAAYLLAEAGMPDASDALLKAELARSHSPYYFMLDLAANARRRGDKAAAIDWTAKAYEGAKGPATRLQWGTTYVDTLVDLAPDDADRIEQAAVQVLGEIEPESASFDGRNRKRLTTITKKLAAWNAKGAHAAQATRIADASRALCDRVSGDAAAQARCGALLNVDLAPRKSAAT